MPILEAIGGVIETSLALIGQDAFLTGWFDGCKKRIVTERRIPGNHDLVKGIRTAHLCALRLVIERHNEILKGLPEHEIGSDEHPFRLSIEDFIRTHLRRFSEHDLDIDALTLDDLDHVLDDILKPSVQEGFEKPQGEARERAIARALEEIETEAGRKPPPLFRRAFDGESGSAGWYDAFSLYIAEELKTNERFRSIFEAGQLVDLKQSVGQITSGLQARHAELARFIGDVHSQLDRVEAGVQDTNKVVRDTQQQLTDQKTQALAVTLEFLFTGPLFKPKIWVQLYHWGANDNWTEFTAWDKHVFSKVPEVIEALEDLKTNLQILVASAPPEALMTIPEAIRNTDALLSYAKTHNTYRRANEKFYWEASRRYLNLLAAFRVLLDIDSLNEGFRTFWLAEMDKVNALAVDIDRRKI